MKLAARLEKVAESQTIKMAKLSRELKSRGIDIIDLSIGEPDFDTPLPIKEAAKKALDEGFTHYSPVAGYPELRKAIIKKLKEENNLEFTFDQVVVSTGAKQAIANVVFSLISPGDEVLIPTPYWVSYSDIVKLGEGEARFITCGFEQEYKLKPGQLEKAIGPKARMIIFSSPCNPTGALYSRSELEALARVLEKHPQIWIVSDEIYEYINYVGSHESIARFDTLRDRMILINGFSKGFAMTGWRLGYSVAPLEVSRACETIQGQFTSGANSIAQRAGLAALEHSREPSYQMVREFRERRDFMVQRLKEIPGLRFQIPQGAFYLFPQVDPYFGKRYGNTLVRDADDLAMYLMEQGHVSTVTGSAFGDPLCIRLSYANSLEKLALAVDRMKEALGALH